MAVNVRPISHDARLPVMEHLGELRIRLIISLATLTAAFGFAFWQNHAVLRVRNRPLEHATAGALEPSRGPLAQAARIQTSLSTALDRQRVAFELLARSVRTHDLRGSRALSAAAQADAAVVAAARAQAHGRLPVTLGIGEPFTQTVTVSAALRAAARAASHPVAALGVRDSRRSARPSAGRQHRY